MEVIKMKKLQVNIKVLLLLLISKIYMNLNAKVLKELEMLTLTMKCGHLLMVDMEIINAI